MALATQKVSERRIDAAWDVLTDFMERAPLPTLWRVYREEWSALPARAQWLLSVSGVSVSDLRLMFRRQIVRVSRRRAS